MKWLGRWLAKVIQNSQDYPEEIRATKASVLVGESDSIEGDEGLNITVRRAIGGRIVSFRHYDRKADRTLWKNYVVPDDLDFERELGKMITLESMRLGQ